MRNLSSILCALSLLAVAGVASATSFNVALLSAMGNNNFDNDVIAKIMADAPFLNISVIKVDAITPSLATLEGYQTVLLMSDSNPFADGVALGNNLKQYIDDGHGVVISGNSNTSTNCGNAQLYQLCGSFQSSDYWAIEPGTTLTGSHLTFGNIYFPNSPLLAGVSSFDGGTFSSRISGSANGSATKIADWSDSKPLIATRTFASGANEVALNFFPISTTAWSGGWVASTDGGRLMANALLYAGNITAPGDTVDTPEPDYLVAGAGLSLVAILLRRRRQNATMRM